MTSFRVCVTVENSPNSQVFMSSYTNRENVFYCLIIYNIARVIALYKSNWVAMKKKNLHLRMHMRK